MISYTLTSYSIPKERAAMIGDRRHDIIGARGNQLASIGVLYGYGDYKELKEAGADEIVKSVEELKKLLLEYCKSGN